MKVKMDMKQLQLQEDWRQTKKTGVKCCFLLDFQSAISGVLEYDSSNRVWQCTECGKSNSDKARVRRHAEIHFQGFVHSCPHCGCQKKTSTALRYHIHAYHNKK